MVALGSCAAIALSTAGCEKQAPGIGQPASNGAISLTIESVKPVPTITSAVGFTLHEGKSALPKNMSALLVEFVFENEGADPVVFNPQFAGLEKAPLWYRKVLGGDGGPRLTALRGNTPTETPSTELDTPGVRKVGPGERLEGWMIFFHDDSIDFDRIVYRGVGDPLTVSLGELPPVDSEIPPFAGIGQPAKAGGMEATVKKVGRAAKLKGPVFTYTPPKGSEFLVLDVQVKNVDRKPDCRILWEVAMVRDADGNLMSNQGGSLTGVPIPGVLSYGSGAIKPGKSLSGKMVFVVDKGAEVTDLRFPVGAAGPPLAVSLE